MTPAFATSFTGTTVTRSPALHAITPRCAMGDSVAPKITLVNTKSDATSKVKVAWQTIPPNVSEAIVVEGNVALNVALRSKRNPKSLPATSSTPCPPGVSPVDFYFPKKTRNLAPVVKLVYDESISVSYDKINAVVGGVEADSVDSVAFWKAPKYKYSAPPSVTTQAPPEVISTEAFERYFPTKIRNRAPMINIRAPKGPWDTTASLEVGNEFVPFNKKLARQVSVSAGVEEPSLAAAATVEKYFGNDIHMAPQILIDSSTPQVRFGLGDVEERLEEAEKILAKARSSSEDRPPREN